MGTHDAALLTRWHRQRDAEAFAQVVTRYSGLVYGTCRRLLGNPQDAQDLAQECFLRLAQADAGSITYVGGWLHRVASNLCRDRLKADRRRRDREHACALPAETAPTAARDEILQRIDAAIEALPERLRYPIVAHFIEGLTHDAIAQTLGITRPAVTRRIERGIARVRKTLDERGAPVEAPALAVLLRECLPEEAPAALKAVLGRWAVAGLPYRVVAPVAAASVLPKALLGTVAAAAVVAVSAYFALRAPSAPPSVAETAAAPLATAAAADAPAPAPQNPAPVVDPAPVPAMPAAAATPASPPAPVELETLEVRCQDVAGNPVAGAEVFAVVTESNSPPLQATLQPKDMKIRTFGPVASDRQGMARFPNLPKRTEPGSASFRVGHQVLARVPGQLVGALGRGTPGSESPTEITMIPVLDMHARVVAPAGYDPSAITVRVLVINVASDRDPRGAMFAPYCPGQPVLLPALFETRPDADGAFAFADLPSRGGIYLAAEGPGLAQAQFMSFEPGKLETVEIVMEPESVIEGSLAYEATGEPAPGFAVLAHPDIRGVSYPFSATVGPDGRFRLAGLPATTYRIAIPMGAQPAEWAAPVTNLSLKPGEVVKGLKLKLVHGGLIGGTVRDAASGAPLADTTVVCLSPGEIGGEAVASGVTGADGRYLLRVAPGSAMLYLAAVPDAYVYPKDQGRKTVNVQEGARTDGTDFQLALSPEKTAPAAPAELQGRVVDTEGQPVAGVAIFEDRTDKHGEMIRRLNGKVSETDEDGRFSVRVAAPATCTYRAAGLGIRSAAGAPVELKPEGRYTLDDIVAERVHGTISGTVVDADGAPVAGATLGVFSEDFSSGADAARTGADGTFTLGPVPEDGDLWITVQKGGYKETTAKIAAGPDQQFVLERQ